MTVVWGSFKNAENLARTHSFKETRIIKAIAVLVKRIFFFQIKTSELTKNDDF